MGATFFRWYAARVQMFLSICLGCRQFVWAAPDELKVDEAEAAHRCGCAEPKVSPTAGTAPGARLQVRSKAPTEEGICILAD